MYKKNAYWLYMVLKPIYPIPPLSPPKEDWLIWLMPLPKLSHLLPKYKNKNVFYNKHQYSSKNGPKCNSERPERSILMFMMITGGKGAMVFINIRINICKYFYI